MFRTTVSLLCLVVVTGGCAATTVELFNGRNFSRWEFVTNPPVDIPQVCKFGPDGAIAATGRPVGFLATAGSYKNYALHAEWRWPGPPGNGGVLVHISSGPKDRQWPLGFQVQLKHGAAGDLLPMADATFADPLTSAPGAATPLRAHEAPDSEKPIGEWNTCDIVCRDGTIEVSINGVKQNRVTGCSAPTGRIGFQFEGTPFELRQVRLTPLD